MKATTFYFEKHKFYVIIITLIFFMQCVKDIERTEDMDKVEKTEENVIRPLIHFTTLDIPDFENMIQTDFGMAPWSVSKILPDIYISRYEFRWISENKEDYVYFIVWINESKEMAFETLKEMQKSYTIGLHSLEGNKDNPTFVGDLSYFKGHEFIRDNYIVRIHESEKYKNSESKIAQYIDSEILKSITFMSIDSIKPIINDFKIEKNPVIEKTKTPLSIQIIDPNNRNITYEWRHDNSSGYGGISIDDLGNYYYKSTWADTSISEIGLTLIAVNDYGFCSDSIIYIKTIKE